jgi:hypothetical protein
MWFDTRRLRKWCVGGDERIRAESGHGDSAVNETNEQVVVKIHGNIDSVP